jgi:hypothetical protein
LSPANFARIENLSRNGFVGSDGYRTRRRLIFFKCSLRCLPALFSSFIYDCLGKIKIVTQVCFGLYNDCVEIFVGFPTVIVPEYGNTFFPALFDYFICFDKFLNISLENFIDTDIYEGTLCNPKDIFSGL